MAEEKTTYTAAGNRYEVLPYNRCGKSGVLLPSISLGLWHNFGSVDNFENGEKIVRTAFDNGITHFDLANNYGPEAGSAESNFGRILKNGLNRYRDELIITTKAGYDMWEGPYGNWGSRKYMIASLDQSLQRMGLDYVDIYYSHRPDPNTPIEETMGALADAVKQGKALYIGLSNYNTEQTREALTELDRLGIHCLVHQDKMNLLTREPEKRLLPLLEREGVGMVCYSPLAQGMLSDRYLNGIPEGSRASKAVFLKKEDLTEGTMKKIKKLNDLALNRGEKLADTALVWLLQHPGVTSVIVGASSTEQLKINLKAAQCPPLSTEELSQIDEILKE